MATDDELEFEEGENSQPDGDDEFLSQEISAGDEESDDALPNVVEVPSVDDLEPSSPTDNAEQSPTAPAPGDATPPGRKFFIGYQPNFTKVGESQPAPESDVPQPVAADEGSFTPSPAPAPPQRSPDYELPIPQSDEDEEHDVVDRLFPPELVNRAAPPAAPPKPPGAAASEPVGQPMPRVQVMVTLADARALFDEALERAATQMAAKFHKIVQFELAQVEFDRKSAARAADYTLRGPT